MTVDLLTAFFIAALMTATPLLLAALGELVVERAGVLNIGLEGMMLAGCFVAFVTCETSGRPELALVTAPIAGAAFALLFAWLVVFLRVDAVVAGTALTLLAIGATAAGRDLLYGRTGDALLVAPLPRLLLPVAALLLVPALAFFLFRTRPGLRLRACGENAEAARALGVPVPRIRTLALCFGGAMAALAGAHLCLAQARTFVEEMTAGRGFVALAVVVCGRWRAGGVLVAALLFGAVGALQFQFQARGSAVPYQFFLVLPYAVTLLVLAGVAGRSRAPAGLNR